MNDSYDPSRDEMADRMMHAALEEKLGGKRPPDLVDRVTGAVRRRGPQPNAETSRWPLVLAVCLLIGLGLAAVMPGAFDGRQVASNGVEAVNTAALYDKLVAYHDGQIGSDEFTVPELTALRTSDLGLWARANEDVVAEKEATDKERLQEYRRLSDWKKSVRSLIVEESLPQVGDLVRSGVEGRTWDEASKKTSGARIYFSTVAPDAATTTAGASLANGIGMRSPVRAVDDSRSTATHGLSALGLSSPPAGSGPQSLVTTLSRDGAESYDRYYKAPALAAPTTRESLTKGWGYRGGQPGAQSLALNKSTTAAGLIPQHELTFRTKGLKDTTLYSWEDAAGKNLGAIRESKTALGDLSGRGLGGGGVSERARDAGIAAGTDRLAAAPRLDGEVRKKEGEGFALPHDELHDHDHPESAPGLEGQGAGQGGDKFRKIVDNAFKLVLDEPLSTFSIDVDTASYSKVRSLLLDHNTLPPPDAVRVEELINYFAYDYAPPAGPDPFATHVEVAGCPWQAKHRLVRVGIKGKVIENKDRPVGNLVFLLDVSGSMNQPNKLPLVKQGMKLLTRQLNDRDRVSIVVYAGQSGLALPSTPGSEKEKILAAIESLQPGGSTAGAAGITLAYQMAQDNFNKDGINRVILCTDGDFNVGVTSDGELQRLIEDKAKTGVFLTCLGFGIGNHNDSMLEMLADKGNGNYGYVDTINEAHKLFVEQLNGTLVTIAKDVKIQVEFNPVHVAGYRLIGYENRILATQDFNDDKKDAGEIGAGHCVTALYEVVPSGIDVAKLPDQAPAVDPLEFQSPATITDAAKKSGNMLVVKLRYKQPDGDTSKLLKVPVRDEGKDFAKASDDFKFVTAVASFGMILRDSPYKGNATLAAVAEIAKPVLGTDKFSYRAEFLSVVEKAKGLGK